MWQDQAFGYDRGLVAETNETLFLLDPATVLSLRLGDSAAQSTARRLNQLISRFYGENGIQLAYTGGHTTGASQTWLNRKGDCLSLTILAYAALKSLRIDAHMQEVRVPFAVDRREGVDFINGHVNVFVRNDSDVFINGRVFGSGGFVIDFEPQVGSRRSGQWLTEDAIMARFYNNRASEYLVQMDHTRAYAYFRAAIEKAPDYAPAYANLAQLYVRQGLLPAAERLLLHAIALGGASYAPLRTMHQLLATQGRGAEAQNYADLLAQRQDEDPYHWMGLGMAALREGRLASAIESLERAAALTTGFEEIHYHLGLAYWRNGQREAANKQLAAMAAINANAPGVSVLSKKLSGSPQPATVF